MKIVICGSMRFADKMVEIYHKLKEMGHEPLVHENLFGVADGTAKEVVELNNHVEHAEIKRKYDYIKAWHDLVMKSDAVLVCNYDKNGIKGYIGANTLIEIGFAHVYNKKIYFLHHMPEKFYCTDEINAMDNVVLGGDLNKLS